MNETTATVPEPTVATDPEQPPIPPTVAAVMASYDEARAKYREVSERFRASVHPDVWKMFCEVEELDGEMRFESMMLHVEELCRHLPGLAPTLRVMWMHVLDERNDRVGRCCTSWPVEP